MIPTWPMVFAALVAGALAGFMVPDRPQSRPSPSAAESDVPAPQAKAKRSLESERTESAAVRAVPIVRSPGEDAAPAPKRDAAGNCASETWPYRVTGCLDRTAGVAPSNTVTAKRVDPAVSLAAEAPAKAEPGKNDTPKSETPKQQIVAAPPEPQNAQPEPQRAQKARAESRPEPAPRPVAGEPRADRDAGPEPREAHRRPARALRDLDFNDGIPTRVYLRGPDGRLYLAPEYRPDGRNRVYVR